MKKFLIASGVAVLAFATVAAAQSVVFTSNLTVGSTGSQVVDLQTFLLGKGYVIPALSDGSAQKGYFGSQTKTAVMKYQADNGVPNTGFVGPLTKAKLNANAGSLAGGTTPPPMATLTVPFPCPAGFTVPLPWVCPNATGTTPPVGGTVGLAGTAGTLTTPVVLSQYNNEEVGDGQTDVKVVGLEVKASKEGDIALKSTKVAFAITNASGSRNLDDYVSSVSVWLGTTKIGSATVSDFNKDSTGNYSKVISFNSGAVLRSDVKQNLYVTVDGARNLDSGDIDSEVMTIDVENVRYEDGAGVVSTDTIAVTPISVSFVSFATSANTILKLITDSSSPNENIVVVNASSDTKNLVLLAGKLKLEGTSDVILDEFPVTLTTDGDSVSAIANTLTLRINGKDYSESISLTAAQTGTVTFDNLDLDIKAGDTVAFTILADVNDIENTGITATDFDEGDYLISSVSATNRSYIVVENESGDALVDSTEKTGTITGEAQQFRTKGIGLTLVSVSEDATVGTSANDDIGLFTIKYKVTAVGDTMYVSSLTTTDIGWAVDKSGTATSSNTIVASLVNNTDTTLTSVGNFMISEGTSETFTLSISVPLGTGGTSGQYRAALTSLEWDTTDDTDMSGGTYSSGLDTFKTNYKVLN